MGDNLAEQLYRAFCSAAGLVYGSDETPGFHNLPTEKREAWEAVASRARNEMAQRFAADLETAMPALVGAAEAFKVIGARWGR